MMESFDVKVFVATTYVPSKNAIASTLMRVSVPVSESSDESISVRVIEPSAFFVML